MKFQKGSMVGSGLLSEASKQAADVDRIVYRDLDELVPNPKNQYSLNKIEELAMTILDDGCITDPIVYLDQPTEDGHFKILAGHRRQLALRLLATQDPKWSKNVPCIPRTLDRVTLPVSDESKEYLAIINANAHRENTEADLLFEYEKKKSIYEEARKNGWRPPAGFKTRHVLADELGVSPAQIGKMDYVMTKATEPVKKAIEEEKINISSAYEIAHLPVEQQENAINDYVVAPEEKDSSESDTPTPKKPRKPRKSKLDELDQESYEIEQAQLDFIQAALSESMVAFEQSPIIADKKTYAKFLVTKEKLEKDLTVLNTLLEKLAKE